MNLKNTLLSSSRRTKQFIVASTDLISFSIAVILACVTSNLEIRELSPTEAIRLLWIPFFSIFIFYLFGVYRSVLRYIDFAVIYLLVKAIITAFLINLILRFIYIYYVSSISNSTFESLINMIGWLVGLLCAVILVVGSRIYANYLFSLKKSEKKVVIYGAGSAGIQLAEALKVSSEMQPVAFLDRDKKLHGTFMGGIKVIDPVKFQRLVKRNRVDEVLIAIPSASRSILRELLKEIEEYSIKVRILPGLAELAQGKILVSELKEVDTIDLLGRFEVEADQDLLNKNIKDKVVLVTGAGGSIGSEIVRQAVKNNPSVLILLDSNEYALYEIKNEIELLNVDTRIHALISNVTNRERIKEICQTFGVNTIYHSAAYKHVPLVEQNPFEGVVNNVFGTMECLNAAIESEVETFVLISTDKAVRPTNIMGATKRFAEMILQSYSSDINLKNKTRMTMVRFGNVLGSSGSAVPLFQKQIREGGPVTVTHQEVTRYFMSIPEASELVIQAGAMGKGGDVFVLDMGEPVKIIDLAKRLISLSGLDIKDEKNPNGDIQIIFTGLRPGEKLYEELLIGDNVSKTAHKQILRAEEDFISKEEIEVYMHDLRKASEKNDVLTLKKIFRKVIHGYESDETISDIISLQNLENKKK